MHARYFHRRVSRQIGTIQKQTWPTAVMQFRFFSDYATWREKTLMEIWKCFVSIKIAYKSSVLWLDRFLAHTLYKTCPVNRNTDGRLNFLWSLCGALDYTKWVYLRVVSFIINIVCWYHHDFCYCAMNRIPSGGTLMYCFDLLPPNICTNNALCSKTVIEQ